MDPLTGNDKRKASCKAVGSEKKKSGHKREDVFGSRFCDPTPTTYKAEADKVITNPELLETLTKAFGTLKSGAVSIKGGSSLQFTLGRIPEVSDADNKLDAIKNRAVWEKYLGKSMSKTPAELLCYKTPSGWIFFKMDSVIDFIVTKCMWRLLPTGRIKGDFADDSRKGFGQYLTYEYRDTHNSHLLGASGNKGKPFIALLKSKIAFVEMED